MGILEKIRTQQISGYLTIKKRIIYPGAVYHITQRAPGREIIFVEKGDYLKFLSELCGFLAFFLYQSRRYFQEQEDESVKFARFQKSRY